MNQKKTYVMKHNFKTRTIDMHQYYPKVTLSFDFHRTGIKQQAKVTKNKIYINLVFNYIFLKEPLYLYAY